MFFCKICQEWCKESLKVEKSNHHILKSAVFGNGETIEVCRTPCHDALEELIRIKENEILRQHPEIYRDALKEITGNYDLIDEMMTNIKKRRKNKRRRR
jgi:hypothetical protein